VPDGTAHQPQRRRHVQAVQQAEPAQEPLAQHGFGLGRPEELVEQVAHRAIPRRPLAGRPVQDVIADRIHVPHREGVPRDRPAEIRRQVAVAFGQQPVEFACLQRRHRHALPVGRVEADHRIAHGQDAVGEAVELVVPPPPAGRVLVDGDLAHRLAAADRRRDMARQDLVGQGAHLVEVLGRVDPRDAERRERPDPVLVEEHPQPERLLARGPGHHDLLLQPVRNPDPERGVADADIDGDLVGPAVTPLLKPHRQPGAAPGRVDDEVGLHGFAAIERHPGHPAALEDRLVDRRSHQFDIRRRRRPSPDLPFQERPTRDVGGERLVQGPADVQYVTRRPEVDEVGTVLHLRHTGVDHVVEQAGEEVVEFLSPPAHQQVDVTALRNGRPLLGSVGQLVALVDRDPVAEIGEHPRRAQPGQAPADDDCVIEVTTH